MYASAHYLASKKKLQDVAQNGRILQEEMGWVRKLLAKKEKKRKDCFKQGHILWGKGKGSYHADYLTRSRRHSRLVDLKFHSWKRLKVQLG